MHKHGLCCDMVSACLSVTFVHYIQTAEDIVKLICRPGSPIILVFYPCADTQIQGNPFSRGVKYKGVGKF